MSSPLLGSLFGLARPLIHALDAETAHTLAVAGLAACPLRAPAPHPALATPALGHVFHSPLGLAAGFDKHAEAIDGALALGFGFVEIGGVTPLPQPGNPRPRVFRLTQDEAVINRYGLNSVGMEVVGQRLAARRTAGRPGLVGVNLGANKASTDRAADYATLVHHLAGLADFLTINVSSPNTPGLRDLQAEAALDDLLARALDARTATGLHTPILIKVAPDMAEAELDALIDVALRRNMDGLIVSNTTIARPGSLCSPHARETGGLSGRPLFEASTRMLAKASLRTGGRMMLIGVGGISDTASALAKIEAGATLLQLYSAMIYRGPGLVADINDGLAKAAAAQPGGLAALRGRRAASIAAGEPI